MKKNKFFSKKTIIGGVIFVAFLFVIMAFSPALAGTGQQIETAQTANYFPAPTMNNNVSWNTFYNGWNPLEYNNGTANKTLNTDLSTIYTNPISVNPVDMEAYGTLQNEKIGSYGYWNDTSLINGGEQNASYPETISTVSLGKATEMEMTGSSSGTGNWDFMEYSNIPDASYPSSNINYDYLTIGMALEGKYYTGTYGQIILYNATGKGTTIAQINAGQNIYISEPLSTWSNSSTNFNISQSSVLNIKVQLQTANGEPANTPYKLVLGALALTDYQIPLGVNAAGNPVVNEIDPTMAHFGSANLNYQAVLNNGYTVATSQPIQNETENQNSINDGQYIEQATVQGIFQLPTAPDLSYGHANITMPITVNTSQFEVMNLNSASYLSALPKTDNETFYFGTVNPNTGNTIIIEQKFTAAQWNSITKAPSFFTLRGIEYYWWVGVIGVLSVVGLGAAAMSHFGGEEETLKVPKGKFGR